MLPEEANVEAFFWGISQRSPRPTPNSGWVVSSGGLLRFAEVCCRLLCFL